MTEETKRYRCTTEFDVFKFENNERVLVEKDSIWELGEEPVYAYDGDTGVLLERMVGDSCCESMKLSNSDFKKYFEPLTEN